MENMGTAPIRVGTYHIVDYDNPTYHYILACVELYDSPAGVTINQESYNTHTDPEGNDIVTVVYSYSYNDQNPITTNTVSSYHLEMFFPTMDPNGQPIIPDYVKIYNSGNGDEKSIGKVNKSADKTMDDPHYELYQPRCVVLANQPQNPSSSLQKFVFIIANTNPEDELRLNAETNGTVINCTTAQSTTNHGVKNASAIMLPLDVSNPATQAELAERIGIINPEAAEYFVYPEVPLQGS